MSQQSLKRSTQARKETAVEVASWTAPARAHTLFPPRVLEEASDARVSCAEQTCRVVEETAQQCKGTPVALFLAKPKLFHCLCDSYFTLLVVESDSATAANSWSFSFRKREADAPPWCVSLKQCAREVCALD